MKLNYKLIIKTTIFFIGLLFVNIISSQSISGPITIEAGDSAYYLLEDLDNFQVTDADWSVEYVDDQENAGSINQMAIEAVEVNWFTFYFEDRLADIIVNCTQSNGTTFIVTKRVTLTALNPYYFSNSSPQYGETSIISLLSSVTSNSHTTSWSLTGGSSIISSTNSSVEIDWNSTGPHTLTALVYHPPTNQTYTVSKTINIDPTYRIQPLIIGKVNVKLNTDLKYDLKTELPTQVQTTWSIVGGVIVDQDNSGAVANWTNNNGGTLTASVDFGDGLPPHIAELEVTKAPDIISPYTGTTSTNENYIKTTTFLEPTLTGQNSNTKKIETITYVDALGRPKQNIAIEAGGNNEHIITHIGYDQYGRQTKEFLPYASSIASTAYRTQAESETNTFYNTSKYENTLNPFSEKQFDGSPLNKIIKTSSPGEDWDANIINEHTIRTKYDIAKNEDDVRTFGVSYDVNGVPSLTTDFESGGVALYKKVVKNENWVLSDLKNNTTEEFTDYQGRTLLKRNYNKDKPHNTYYVYDDYENLIFVISPKGSDDIVQSTTDQDFSQYIYGSEIVSDPTIYVKGGFSLKYTASTNILDISFRAIFTAPSTFKTGAIAELDYYFPDMILGTLTEGGVNYEFSIVDGWLHVNGTGTINGLYGGYIAGIQMPETYIDDVVLNELCYQYRYDNRNRLMEKKIPGKDWEYIVYDKLDRPVLTQDALLKSQNKWLFTKYDVFNRVAYTGMLDDLSTSTMDRESMQAQVDLLSILNESPITFISPLNTGINGHILYYTNSGLQIPNTNLSDLYTVNYYDTYNPQLTDVSIMPIQVLGENTTSNTNSLPTGSRVKVLGSSSDWVTSVTYYDEKARPIYIASKNDYLDTTDIIEKQLDFTGNVLQTKSYHTKGTNNTIEIIDNYTYDHANRLLTQKQKIDNQSEELIVSNQYDELGQLDKKEVGNIEASPLQTIDFAYNIRGWLKTVNDLDNLGNDLFSFKLNYNNKEGFFENIPTYSKLYNGNISQSFWKSANDNVKRGYTYKYDHLNRISSAINEKNDNPGLGRFHLIYAGYDKNGNISALNRNGHIVENPDENNAGDFGLMDALNYTYQGNKLLKVSDNAVTPVNLKGDFKDGTNTDDDYTYDSNGNMVEDKNKGITLVEYNHLNLPIEVIFHDESISNPDSGKITYKYDATGVKLSKLVSYTNSSSTIATFYAGNFIYEQNGGAPEGLKFFSHPEGYIEPDSNGAYNYIYQYKDHLGNIRVSYSDSDNSGSVNSSEIIEENNYYPFGLKHKGYNDVVSANVNSVASKFKYNGMEQEEALGLNLYEMDMREYDPAIARWTAIDPVTHYDFSTYSAFDNNPVFWSDPSGANSEQQDDFYGSFGMVTIYGGGISFDGNSIVASGYIKGEEESDSNSEGDPPNKYKEYFESLSGFVDDILDSDDPLSQELKYSNKCLLCIAGRNKERDSDSFYNMLSAGGKGASLIALNLSRFDDIAAIESGTQLRWIGRGAAGLSVGIDYLRYRSGKISGSEFSMNTTWTSVGVFGSGGGLLISSIYYFAGEVLGGKAMARRNFERIQRMRVEDPEAFRKWKRTAKCFVAGTKILMSDGLEKNIEDIKEGDKILSVNTSNFNLEEDSVKFITKFKGKKIIKMILADGKEFKFTEDHPFWIVGKGWSVFNTKSAKNKLTFYVNELKNKDYVLVYVRGKLIPVQIIKLFDTKKNEDVYNLDNVEKNNTFFANKTLVHNRAN